MKKAVEATPTLIDTLKKAKVLVNTTKYNPETKPAPPKDNRQENSLPVVGQICPARVVGGDGTVGYTCDIFGNGLENPATTQGIVYLANGASTLWVLPPGTILYVQKAQISAMGSVEGE
jgi:hypothetical protein